MLVTSYDDMSEELDKITARILTSEVMDALKKKLSQELNPIWENAVNEVVEGASESVSYIASSRAEKFLEAVLAGDADAAKNLFGLTGFTGRERDRNSRGLSGPGPVIHGQIFESEPIKLRRQIVEAHADLLRNARIDDLEDQVEAMRTQIERLQKEIDTRWR